MGKNPNSITLPVVQKILEKTGVSYEELTGWKKPIPKHLDVNNTWEKANFTKCTLSDYISTALGDKNLPDEYKKAYVEDLNNVITANLVKPKVAIVGRSDTGKSTLINALLGTDKMPTSWTPTTSIAVYIKHVADKPAFIEEDAWVFANQVGAECLWDERKLNDESYCRSWKIAAGGVEILHSFGTRQGENYNKEAGSAVVFIDAPVLKTCDIVDLPGFGTETESDDDITFATAQKADVVLYLSQANGFMRIEDITYLKRNISELPTWEKKGENSLKPLSNLFVIASQAHTVNSGNRVQLEKILDVGCANLIKTLPNEYWANRKKLSGYDYADNGFKELRSRFFAYTIDIPDICSPFNNALTEILESLPAIKNERTKAFVKSYVELRKPNLINELHKYEGIVRERDKYVTLLSEIEKNELSRTQDNDKRKKGVRDEIARLSSESIDEFSEYMAATINTDALVRLMKDRGIKNTKGDIEVFWSYLQSMIQERCETILAEKSEILSEKTKEYITSYAKNISYPFENNSIDVDFDAGWAFASAILTGVARFLFGSIGIVIGLLIAGGLGLVFGGGWEKSVAEKIVAHFDENDFSEKFRDRIRQYWQQTEEAFDKAAAELENEWDTYVRNLRDTVNGYDIQEIQHRIASLNYLSDFFKNIPL